MHWRSLLWLLVGFDIWSTGLALPQKSVSSSRQFVVYCEDFGLRSAVTGFAEQVKSDLLDLLGVADQWKYPVVIQITRQQSASPGTPESVVGVYETELGMKIQLDVVMGSDPTRAKFREQLAKAVLLEIAHRKNPSIAKARVVPEPPQWVVIGALSWADTRKSGLDSDVFKALIQSQRPPLLSDFLIQRMEGSDSASEELFRACSLALVKLIVEMPEGRPRLAAFLQDLPQRREEIPQALGRHFPELAGSPRQLEKWWLLSLARLAAADRYLGLGFEETTQRLDALLELRLVLDGNEQSHKLAAFKEYLKLAPSRPALSKLSIDLLALTANASPLLRPIVAEYHAIVTLLAQGKTSGIPGRLAAVESDRQRVIQRLGEIADYMNWFEATQMSTLSGEFHSYLQRERAATAQPRNDAISRYLDSVAAEFE